VGVPFFLVGGTDLRNLGPLTNVMGDVTMTASLPADCIADTPASMLIPGTTLPINMNIFVSGGWTVTCFQAGSHTFGITASVAPSSPTVVDTNPANNSASGSLSCDVS
jgi:hypothetical protein